jgi:hypothetical protein
LKPAFYYWHQNSCIKAEYRYANTMSHQEFDTFKQKLKDWMDSHPEEYDCFEAEMNRKDNAGYQKILSMAFTIVPQYKKIIKKKSNQGVFNDISGIETMFEENNLAESLISEIENTPKKSIVPAMLSWLYFGKSFERMVERGEEIRKNEEIGYFEKMLIASTIKLIMSKSISLGLRTKEDWDEHRQMMQVVDGDELMDWAIGNLPNEKKKAGRKSNEQTLPEMLSATTTEKPEDLIERIEKFLLSKNSKRDIACLKIVLEELTYINPSEVRTFRNALEKQFGKNIHIISERGIQDANKELNDFIGGKQVKDIKENRDYIQEIKTLLSN